MLDKTAPTATQMATVVHLGRTYQVTPRPQFEAEIADAVQRAKTAGLVPGPAPTTPRPATFSLAQSQTPFRNQEDRGTCWAFAGGAAVEAAYKRKYGLDLYLS